jgi:hypothetical protein
MKGDAAMRRLAVLASVLITPLLLGSVVHAQDASPDASPVAASGDFVGNVDIGGRTLNLECSGTGGPTVVFEASLGDGVWVWSRVQPQVAAFTRACAYDRADVPAGFSDPTSDTVRTAEDVAADLHALLAAYATRSKVGSGSSSALERPRRSPDQRGNVGAPGCCTPCPRPPSRGGPAATPSPASPAAAAAPAARIARPSVHVVVPSAKGATPLQTRPNA